MFSPVKMARLDALLLGRDARAALRRLGEAGAMELAPAGDGAPCAPAADKAGLAEISARLARIAKLRAALSAAVPGAAALRAVPSAPDEALTLEVLEARAEAPLARRSGLLRRRSELGADLAALKPYAGLTLPSDLKFSFVYCAPGRLPADRPAPAPEVALRLDLPSAEPRAVFFCPVSKGAALRERLKADGFRPEVPPSRPGSTFAALAAGLSAEAALLDAALAANGNELASLYAEAAGPLAGMESLASRELALLKAEGELPRTASAVRLSGWLPQAKAGAAAGLIAGACGGACAVETVPAGPGSDAPVLLDPPRLLRPFAALVTVYGLPRYGEVEPTAFAAVIYLLMFGMMFGDAGHGAVVALGGLWLAGRGGKLREAGKAAFGCGLSAMAFGLVYGSYFGAAGLRKYALWRDPLEGDPLTLPLIAVACGAAVITLGAALNIVNRLRAGDRLGAALDRFGAAGLVFYWSGIMAVAGIMPARAALPLMALGVLCWALKGPLTLALGGKKNPGEISSAAAESAVGAFEGALLYLANTVSFVRLAAYAMSHAALVASAWLLAGAADGIWGPGSLAGVLAVIAGNAAAIGLEGLVAAVQALRLEYYEFFGKFFEGGGRPFKPFSFGGENEN